MNAEQFNQVTEKIIGAAIQVHRALGPGLLESAYEACLAYELIQQGFHVEQQKPLPILYKGAKLDCGYRLDMVVEDAVVVELKSIDALAPIHQAQMISYLKLSEHPVDLLINFHVVQLKDGIQRLVNKFPDSQRSLRSQR